MNRRAQRYGQADAPSENDVQHREVAACPSPGVHDSIQEEVGRISVKDPRNIALVFAKSNSENDINVPADESEPKEVDIIAPVLGSLVELRLETKHPPKVVGPLIGHST